MAQEIRGQTWDLDGPQLEPFQAAQRLYKAGFTDAKILVEACATMYGESGWYVNAWHHNVLRDQNKQILLNTDGKMTITSTDLGFIQKNVVWREPIVCLPEQGAFWAKYGFETYPSLARADKSADIAYSLFMTRGFTPWYAHSYWTRHKARSVEAVADFLAVAFGLGKNFFTVTK
jgi:hypothetical protein